MATVHRAYGYRFVIFVNDHGPPHVHVVGAGGEAKIILSSPERPELERVLGIGRANLRRILDEARRERFHRLAAWRRIHE